MAYRSLSHQDIQEFLSPDETAAALLKRLRDEQVTTGVPFLDHHVQLRPGCILEVCGPVGCGKTTLLVQVAVQRVISAWTGAHTQQAGTSSNQAMMPSLMMREHAVIVDMDGKFDGLLLFQMLRRQLVAAFPQLWAAYQQAEAALGDDLQQQPLHSPGLPPPLQAAVKDWQEMEVDCLTRVHVVKAHNSVELLAGLLAVRRHARAWKAAGEECAVLLLDNVGAFTYMDKAARPHPYNSGLVTAPVAVQSGLVAGQVFYAGGGGGGGGGGGVAGQQAGATSSLTSTKVYTALTALLAQFSQELRTPVIATRNAQVTLLEPDAQGPARLNSKEFMPDSWVKSLTHRLLLGPPVVSLRPGVGATTAVPAQIWKGSQLASLILHVLVGSDGLHAAG